MMYKYLFGNTNALPLYDIIGILGYLLIIGITFSKLNIKRKSESLGVLALRLNNSGRFLPKSRKTKDIYQNNIFWAKKEISILFLVHIVTYTFGGEIWGHLIGRRTDYYGYIFLTNFAICLVCYVLGLNVLQELDNLVPIYLSLASLLKIGCLCAGCCNGYEWEYGLYNHYTEKYEVPIQLIESFFYFAFLLFITKKKKKFTSGNVSPIFLIIYALFRFIIQFFRADAAPFSFFHCISLFAMIVGITHLLIIQKYRQQIIDRYNRKTDIQKKDSENIEESHESL